MNKGIIGTTLVGIVVLVVVALFIKNTQPQELHPWKLLPDTPAMVIEANNPTELYEKLKYGNDIWESLTKIQSFNKLEKQIEYLDSLIDDNKYHDAIFTHPILIAFYADSINTKTLLISSIDDTPNLETLKSFLNNKLGLSFGIITKQEAGFNLLRIVNGQNNFSLSLGFAGNMMVVSKSEDLVRKALEQYQEALPGHFSNAPMFVKLRKTAGKKLNTHLYLNGTKIKSLLAQYISPEQQKSLSAIDSSIQWSETDLFLKKNELILNGLSIEKPTEINSQHNLNQKPQVQDYTSILPFNTNIFLFKGFSNFNDTKQGSYKKLTAIDIDKLSNLVGTQVIYVSTARNAKELKNKSFVAIRLNDKSAAQKLLNTAAKVSGKLSVKSYNQYTISKLHRDKICQVLFGDFYGAITENYFVFIDDYVVFSNNSDELFDWLRMYETGKTLDLNENFKPFSNKLTETSNLTLFLRIRDLTKVAPKFVNRETAEQINSNTSAIKDFEGALLQLSNQNSFIFTNLFIKKGKNLKQNDNLALWKVKLEDDIVGKPYAVKDHTTGLYNIMVFDKSLNVYLIRYDGTILWKKQIKGVPESDVFQVDYFKNGKLQYLFNSSEYFYLFDKNGNNVKQYPIKINPSATNGVSVFDYNNKKNYRLILAQSDKRVYNYDIKGRKVKGWKTFKLSSIVTKPVQHLVAKHKDYLFITDKNNHVKIINRRGSERIHTKGKLNKAVNSIFYVNKTNGKGLFITTNKEGKLVYISSSGVLRYTDFGRFSPNHYFLYEDFDGNGAKDFVFVDGNKLTVFDRFKKVLFKYTFKYDILIKPVFFNLGKNKRGMAVVSNIENTIYIFDKNANTNISKGLIGDTPVTIISLKNNRDINLITGSGNTLLNYRIK